MNDELLASYLLNEGNDETRQFVEQWIIENPANRRYFEHFRIIWEASSRLVLPCAVNEEQAWQKFRQRTYGANAEKAIVKNIRSSFKAFKIAAAVIVCAGIIAMSYFILNNANVSPVTIAATNAPASNTLPDGSAVTLNKNSSISYKGKFKGAKRSVELKGEAFFNVKPDKNKPFVIEVNDVTVTVVGTTFNIKSENGNTEVIVETGSVVVEKNNISVTLNPGEKIIIGQTGSTLAPEKTKDKLYNYYITKEFVCDDTPLWKLVEILNEAYESNIVIANPGIRNLPLTTTFHNEPLDNILTVISETFNITVERQDEKIILK